MIDRDAILPGAWGPGYDAAFLSDVTGVDTGSETLVQQQFGPEVDINNLVRRFGLTAADPKYVAGGVYGDFSGITDYESAVASVERARGGFMQLPADVRERFGNDPGRLVRLAQDVPEEEFLKAVNPVVPPVVAPVAPVLAGGGVSPPPVVVT